MAFRSLGKPINYMTNYKALFFAYMCILFRSVALQLLVINYYTYYYFLDIDNTEI